MERDADREYDVIPDDERVEPLVEPDDLIVPPPTVDPDERVEVEEDDDVVPDEDRPV